MMVFDYAEKFNIVTSDPLSQKLKGFLVDVHISVQGPVAPETGMILNLSVLMECMVFIRSLKPQGFAFAHILDAKDFFENEIRRFFKLKNILSLLSKIELSFQNSVGPAFSIILNQSMSEVASALLWSQTHTYEIEEKSSLGSYQSEHLLVALWKCESFFNSFDQCALSSDEWKGLLQDTVERGDESCLQGILAHTQSQFGAELIELRWTRPNREVLVFRK